MSILRRSLAAAALAVGFTSQAYAGIPPVSAPVAQGVDASDGIISVPVGFDGSTYSANYQWNPDSGFAGDIQSFSFTGSPDPSLAYSFGVTNNTNAAETFAFDFALPILTLTQPFQMKASLQGTLTANADAGGATVSPLMSGGTLQHAFVVDGGGVHTVNLAALDTGWALGPTPGGPGSGGTQYTYGPYYKPGPTAAGLVAGPTSSMGGYTILGVRTQFVLSAGDSFSANGYVELDPVPEPSTWILLAGGLGVAGVIGRRRLQEI